MRVLAPQAVDKTLLDEVVDVLAILNKQYDQIVFDSLYVIRLTRHLIRAVRLERQVLIHLSWRPAALPVGKSLVDLRIQVTPEQATHALNGICHVVRRRHVDTTPAKALVQ